MGPRFNSILVSVTEACHVGCAHCGFIGSKRDREADEGELASWVREACVYGIPTIIFTGGEAFERFELLRRGVAAATEEGVPSAVFTSSFWATSRSAAREALSELAGLEHLYLSSDVYHQRRVPYENVWNAIDAASDVAIPKVSIVITYARQEDLVEVRSNYERYADRVRICEERVIPTRYNRRAVADQDALREAKPENFPVRCWLDTPIINPNGDIFACHVGKAGAHASLQDIPYWLGNLRTFSFVEIMEMSARRADYQFLRTHGPRGVASLYVLYPELSDEIGRSAFTGECDMCFSALSTRSGRNALFDHVRKPEVLAEINARLALLYHELPLAVDEVQVGPPQAVASPV